MADDLIRNYIDRQAFASDTEFAKQQLAELEEAYKIVRDSRANMNAAKGTGTMVTEAKQATTAVKEMVTAVTAQNQVIGEGTKIFNTYGNSLQQNIVNLNNYKKALDANKADLKEANELRKLGVLSEEDYRKKITELTAAQFKYKQAISDTTKEIKNQTQLNIAAPTSILEARTQNKQLTTQRDLLPTSDKEGIAALNALIDRNNKLIDENSDKLARQKINIGNYSGAVSFLKESLTEVGRKIDENTKSGQANSAATEKLKKEYEILDQLVNSQTAGFTKASMEVRENEKALLKMAQAGLQGTDAFKKLSLATGKLKDDIADVSARTKALGSDTFAFDSMIQGAQALAGAYGVAQGAAALFGDENEELQKTFVKLQAIMTVIQGLQSIATAMQKESAFVLGLVALKEKALTAIQVIRNFVMKGTITATKEAVVAENLRAGALTGTTVATRVATGAMIGLRAALISTGIGALLLLLPLAVSAMSSFGDKTDDAKDSVDRFNNSLEATNRIMESTNKGIDRRAALQTEHLKQIGAKQSEIDAVETKALLEKQRLEAQNFKEKMFQLGVLQDHLKQQQKNGADEDDLKATTDKIAKITDAAAKSKQIISDLQFDLELKDEQNRTKAIEDAKNAAKKGNSDKELQESLKRAQAFRDAAAAEMAKMNEKEIQDEKDKYKTIAEDQKKSLQERTLATIAFNEAGKRLLELQKTDSQSLLDAEIEKDKKAAKTKEELAAIETVRKAKQATIDKTFASDSAKFQTEVLGMFRASAEDDYKAIEEAAATAYEKIKQAAEQSFSDQQDQIQIEKNNKLLELNRDYNDGRLKNLTEYESKATAIEEDAARRQKQLELDRLKASEAVFELQSMGLLKNYNLLKQISDLEVEIIKDKNAKIIASEKEKNEKIINSLNDVRDKTNQAFDVISGFINANATSQKNILEDQSNAIDKNYQREVDLINASTLAEQDKAAKITVLNAKNQAQKEQIALKQKQIDRDQAVAQKAQAIFNIALNTAIAVTKALPNIPLSILVGFLGAAQMAAAIATPIPRFKHGKNNSYEGPAIVGDGGVPEFIKREDGSIQKTPPRDTLTFLNKNDVVYPNAHDMLVKLAMPKMRQIPVIDNLSEINAAVENQTKILRPILNKIANKQTLHLGASDRGFVALWKHGASMTKYINEQTNW